MLNKLLELFPANPEDGTTIINGRIFHTETDDIGNPIIHESSADCFGKLLDCFKEYEKECGKFLYINKDFKSKLFETFMKSSTEKSGMGHLSMNQYDLILTNPPYYQSGAISDKTGYY